MMIRSHIFNFLSLFLLTISLNGQVTTDVSYKTAHNGALMGSNIAYTTDGNAVFTNPAVLTSLKDAYFLAGYQTIFGRTFLPYSVFATGMNLPGELGHIGLSFESMEVNYEDKMLSGETTVGISHGFRLRKDRISSFSAGYTLKMYHVNYGQSAGISGDGSDGIDLGSASTFGLDIGFQASLSKRHWIGVIVHNINRPQLGSGASITDLPRDIQAGFSYAPNQQVITSFALMNSLGHDLELHAGLEYKLSDNFTLLSGIQSNPNRFGAGFRFHARSLNVDYALLTHPVLPVTHQFTLAYTFKGLF